MARVRRQTYAEFAWPSVLGPLYKRNGLAVSGALVAGLTLFLVLPLTMSGSLWRAVPEGNFYAVFSHQLMVALFAPVFVFSVIALGTGVRRFWRKQEPGAIRRSTAAEAAFDTLRLKHLDGGHGEGCNNADDAFTPWRRYFHHLTFYGFLLCFAATCVASVYHYFLGWEAPYDFWSVPKLLGTSGGVTLVVGSAGLLWLNLSRHPMQQDDAQKPMDRGFIMLLLLIAASGLLLMIGRLGPAMPLLLSVHLGAVMALFLTLPYGKFAHGVYRAAALLKWAIERHKPNSVGLPEG